MESRPYRLGRRRKVAKTTLVAISLLSRASSGSWRNTELGRQHLAGMCSVIDNLEKMDHNRRLNITLGGVAKLNDQREVSSCGWSNGRGRLIQMAGRVAPAAA